eukprot:GHUV01028227.1.p1 GENE.GHUV01028227.1~~GHUV01028227.1.p1  ORF type:complete len:125 (-),score=37.53 GHUV01028227.1:331-705(-)
MHRLWIVCSSCGQGKHALHYRLHTDTLMPAHGAAVCSSCMQVVLANQGAMTHADPKVQKMHEQLSALQDKLDRNDLDIPPEHERSPSPEPIYDANGVRLNTREIRCDWCSIGPVCLAAQQQQEV